jgi:hypothetical protein
MIRSPLLVTAVWASLSWLAPIDAGAASLANDRFKVTIGTSGEISSLQLVGDAFPTNYVMNAANAPGQDTADHEWMGELMFTYRQGTGAWQTALTQSSGDARSISSSPTSVTVKYANSANAKGVRAFELTETYALVDDHLSWQITLTNPGAADLEFGDVGLPLPFNEFWFGNDVIYETRTVYHSFTGQNSSYLWAARPSGIGPFLLLTPDATTGAGFEYMDAWIQQEHRGSAWAANGGSPAWPSGLDVFYIHSNVIKSTNRGYLPNTSLMLSAGTSKTYAFRFCAVADQSAMKQRLYTEGLVDVTAVPGMMLASDMTAKIDLHTSKTINAVTPQFPDQTVITSLGALGTDHHGYQVSFSHLGPNNLLVEYGTGEKTTLQFYVLEPLGTALQRHATFVAADTQQTSGAASGVFDDWLMDPAAKRGAFGGNAWGDDWGWTHGEFLAEKNAQTPVATEVSAIDKYLDAIWATAIDDSSYVVQDWWCPRGTSASNPMNCFYDRAYAYPHAFNTYFAMYRIAHLYPTLVTYHQPADTYLMRAYDILHTLYSGHGDPGTGYMGEQTLPEIMQALSDAGHATEASFVGNVIKRLYMAFQNSKYPYGSEYSYDNTGEEAVYMSAKQNGDMSVLGKVNAKTRACRGQEPVWYYYADPVTVNGENWWQFQYTAALAGYCMDDWLRTYSTTPELDERLSYAAKIANVSAINSGQIDSNVKNLGTVAWSYQAMKGNTYINSFDPPGMLHNGWRQMSGEADLGLFGAIRILSADVAVDPLFGVYGYGCDVQKVGSCYAVTPKDGVWKRLNLITEKFHLELERDRYTGATVSLAKDYVGFTLQNQTGDAHTSKLTMTGMPAGTYPIQVAGAAAGTLTVTAGKPAVVSLAIGGTATSTVQIGTGCDGRTDGAGGATIGAGGTAGSGGGPAAGRGGAGGAGGTIGSGGIGVGSGGTSPGTGTGGSATGGRASSGGSSGGARPPATGSGGNMGSGGALSSSGGGTGSGTSPAPTSSSGCSCTTASSSNWGGLMPLLLLALGWCRKRR